MVVLSGTGGCPGAGGRPTGVHAGAVGRARLHRDSGRNLRPPQSVRTRGQRPVAIASLVGRDLGRLSGGAPAARLPGGVPVGAEPGGCGGGAGRAAHVSAWEYSLYGCRSGSWTATRSQSSITRSERRFGVRQPQSVRDGGVRRAGGRERRAPPVARRRTIRAAG